MRFGDTPESERWVQWQFVPPSTPLLDRTTVFGSIQWGSREPVEGPGEVVGAPRIWTNGRAAAWPYGAPPCGSVAQWGEGFGTGTLPSLPLGEDGVPICCSAPEPVPVPPCPAGLPPVVYGQLMDSDTPPGSRQLPFTLAHVPGSIPPQWVGQLDWSILGGSAVDTLTWFPNGGGDLNDMALSAVGCLTFFRDFAALFGVQTCSQVEWWYGFNGVFFCSVPPMTLLTYRIRTYPF